MRKGWLAVLIGVGLVGGATPGWADPMQVLAPAGGTTSAWRHDLPTPALGRSLDQLARLYPTPKAVAGFLRAGFSFTPDAELFGKADHWQSPEEFLSRRAGDCEDYALLARALLRRNGVEAQVFSVYGVGGYAHTVCVYKDAKGRFNMINQHRHRKTKARTLEALAWQLYPAWTHGGLAEPTGTTGRLTHAITNPHPAPSLAFTNRFAGLRF